jgi:lysyl-tRNA synthetase, class II
MRRRPRYAESVRLRLTTPRPESLLAWAAAAVGIIGVISSLTPEYADRFRIVHGVLPPGIPTAARVGALAFGLALVWLARSLARRRYRAWQLAVTVIVLSAVAHLAKGLDVEEATISLGLLVALLVYRKRFDVPGDPAAIGPLLGLGAFAVALAAVAVSIDLRGVDLPDRVSDFLTAVGFLVGFSALYLWLRPVSHAVRQTVGERRSARAVVDAYGSDSLSFFSLRRDKSYFFSPTRRSFLAYRVVAGAALVSADPVGDEEEFDALLAEFRRVAKSHGWRLAVLGASEQHLERYARLGLPIAIAIGDEAVLRPDAFSLDGRAIRKVRQSVSRLTKAGFGVRIVPAEDADDALREQLDAVSEAWRGNQPERGFTMSIDDLYVPGTVFAVAECENGRVGGFLHLAPSAAGGSWSLSTMRRHPSAPNGVTEYLIVETLAWAKEQDVNELSLNFCVFTDFICPERAVTISRRFMRRALLAADNVFQLERLYAFNKKFFPEWRPRYLCLEKRSDLPVVGLAYLHVEQLLVPPGPWAARRVRKRAVPA